MKFHIRFASTNELIELYGEICTVYITMINGPKAETQLDIFDAHMKSVPCYMKHSDAFKSKDNSMYVTIIVFF